MLLFALLAAAQAAPDEVPVVEPDRLFVMMMGRVYEGALLGPSSETVSVDFVLIDSEGGFEDPALQCQVKLQADALGAPNLDASAWPHLWAAWSLEGFELSGASEACGQIDPARMGGDAAQALADAGWSIGLGPMAPAMGARCRVREGNEAVVPYAWMEGAEPMPMGLLGANALDEEGNWLDEPAAGASTADSLPDMSMAPGNCSLPAGV